MKNVLRKKERWFSSVALSPLNERASSLGMHSNEAICMGRLKKRGGWLSYGDNPLRATCCRTYSSLLFSFIHACSRRLLCTVQRRRLSDIISYRYTTLWGNGISRSLFGLNLHRGMKCFSFVLENLWLWKCNEIFYFTELKWLK